VTLFSRGFFLFFWELFGPRVSFFVLFSSAPCFTLRRVFYPFAFNSKSFFGCQIQFWLGVFKAFFLLYFFPFEINILYTSSSFHVLEDPTTLSSGPLLFARHLNSGGSSDVLRYSVRKIVSSSLSRAV